MRHGAVQTLIRTVVVCLHTHTHTQNWMSFFISQVAISLVTPYCAAERGKVTRGIIQNGRLETCLQDVFTESVSSLRGCPGLRC